MRPLRYLLLVSVLIAMAGGCGDDTATTTRAARPDPPTGVTATIAASSTTTTASTTTTTTAPPTTTTTTTAPTTTAATTTTTTTTTTLPPVAVQGWDGEGVDEVALVLEVDPGGEVDPAGVASGMEGIVASALRDLRIDQDAGAEAVLSLDLQATPLSAVYGDLGRCYTGARVQGTLRLEAPDRPAAEAWISGEVPTPFAIFGSSCVGDPAGAPWERAFEPALVDGVVAVWGPGSVPVLVRVVDADLSGEWSVHLAAKEDAIAAYRGFAAADVPDDQERAMLLAALGITERLLESVERLDQDLADNADAARFAGVVERLLDEALDAGLPLASLEDAAAWRAVVADHFDGG